MFVLCVVKKMRRGVELKLQTGGRDMTLVRVWNGGDW